MILPTPTGPFDWREFGGQPGLVCVPLERLAAHVFTTSEWTLGRRSADAEAPDPWPAVARAVGVAAGRLVRARQIHGVAVVVGSSLPADGRRPDADIIVLSEPGAAAAVQVADCVPMLIADDASHAVAAVHAGWRGMAARAPQVAIEALGREFGARPRNLLVALGPSIGACCYEVGPDMRRQFAAGGFDAAALRRWFIERPLAIDGNPPMAAVHGRPSRPDRWFFDGWGATREQIVEAGVPAPRIFAAGLCTASHPEVFCSYRRDGSPSGRMAAAISCEASRP